MVCAKKELFDKELQNEADIFKVLSHPARLQILTFLSNKDKCFCGDITEELPLGRTTINQHLKELKNANLIQGHIDGNKVNYCLNTKGINNLKSSIEKFLEQIKSCKEYTCSDK